MRRTLKRSALSRGVLLAAGAAFAWLVVSALPPRGPARGGGPRLERRFEASGDGKEVEGPAPEHTAAPGTSTVTPPLAEALPNVTRLRAEVERAPHSPPPALLEFARSLALRRELLESGLLSADGFFAELADCARSGETVSSAARALCLREAERLAEQVPGLREARDRLRSQVPGRLRLLIELLASP